MSLRGKRRSGLRSATDGEFRRAMWHFDFLEQLDGVESFRSDHGIAFKGGIETKPKAFGLPARWLSPRIR